MTLTVESRVAFRCGIALLLEGWSVVCRVIHWWWEKTGGTLRDGGTLLPTVLGSAVLADDFEVKPLFKFPFYLSQHSSSFPPPYPLRASPEQDYFLSPGLSQVCTFALGSLCNWNAFTSFVSYQSLGFPPNTTSTGGFYNPSFPLGR